MSESSQHVLNKDLDLTGFHTDEESLEIENVKGRGRNKEYEPVCSFKSLETAKNLLKNRFFDSQWTQLNTINNVVWFKCKLCAKSLL